MQLSMQRRAFAASTGQLTQPADPVGHLITHHPLLQQVQASTLMNAFLVSLVCPQPTVMVLASSDCFPVPPLPWPQITAVVLKFSKDVTDPSKVRNFAFVHYEERASALKAVEEAADGTKYEIDGQELSVGGQIAVGAWPL